MIGYIKKLVLNNLKPSEIKELIYSNELEKLKQVSDDSYKAFIYEQPLILLELARDEKYIEVFKLLSKFYDLNLKSSDGWTALHWAAREVNIPIVEFLISKKVNLNIQATYGDDEEGFSGITALYDSINGSRWGVAKLLIKAGADVNLSIQTGNQDSLLQTAINYQDIDFKTIEMLVDAGAVINATNKNGWTALHWAVRGNHLNVVEFLLNKNANINAQARYNDDEEGFTGFTPLYDAVSNSFWDVAKFLIKKGADVNIQKETDNCESVLQRAIMQDNPDLETIKMIIEKADVNYQNKNSWTALHYASRYNNTEILSLLIQAGANLNLEATYNDDEEGFAGITTLYDAISQSNWEIVNLLLDAKVDVNIAQKTKDRFSPILRLSYNKEPNLDVLESLVNLGANINDVDKDGWSALHLAASNGEYSLCEKLIELGINSIIYNNENKSPSDIAKEKGHDDIVYLISNNQSEFFEIHELIVNNKTNEAKKLIEENKALVNLQNSFGHSSLDLAMEYGNIDLVKYIFDISNSIDKTSLGSYMFRVSIAQKIDEDIQVEIFEQLIDYGVDINIYHDELENTLLHICLKNKHLKLAKLLILKGANLELQELTNSCQFIANNKNAPLHIAVSENLLDFINILLEKGVDIDAYNGYSETALYIACKRNDLEAVKLLVKAGADISKKSIERFDFEEGNIERALKDGNEELFDYLFENGALIDDDSNFKWSVERAFESGSINLLKRMISVYKDTNSVENDEFLEIIYKKIFNKKVLEEDDTSYLELLIEHSYINIESLYEIDNESTFYELICKNELVNTLNFLLEREFDFNKEDSKGDTLLAYSAILNTPSITKILVDAKVDLDIQNENGWTALMIASKKSNEDIIKLLIESGANLDLKNNKGWTALIISSKNNLSEITKLLIGEGANLDIQSNDSWSALMVAVHLGHEDIVKILIDAKANLELSTENNWTALMIASNLGFIDISKLLIKADANLDAKTKKGSSALILASNKEHTKVTNLLLNEGAFYHEKHCDYLMRKEKFKALVSFLEFITKEKFSESFESNIMKFDFKNTSFELVKTSQYNQGVKLKYENSDHETVSNFGSYFDKIVGIENFRYYYKKDKLVLDFMKPTQFNTLLKECQIENTYLDLHAIKEINHSKYLFIKENENINYKVCKQNKEEIEKYLGSTIDIEEYDEVHDLYDPEFSENRLIIIKESVINSVPKLLGISGRYLKSEVLDGVNKFYFKDANFDEWSEKLDEVCQLLKQRLSINSQNNLLVLTEKIEEVIPKLLDLKDSHKNSPKLELVKEENGVTKYFYTALPELDLNDWKQKARKISFRNLFNEPNKVYELSIYNKTSEFYDEEFSTKQYIVLNEFDSIPTKEELEPLSVETLKENQLFLGYRTGKTKYYIENMNDLSHMMIIGGTGSGKSNFMNGLITSFLNSSDKIQKMYLIDLKSGIEFNRYKELNSDKIDVFSRGTKPSKLLEALYEVEAEMYLREEYMVNNDITKMTKDPIFVIIDEFAQIDLMYSKGEEKMAKNEIFEVLLRIATRARSANIKLLLQTQDPRSIPDDLRKLLMSRVLLKTGKEDDKNFTLQNPKLLDEYGIEHIEFDKGRYVFEDYNDGDTKLTELQFPFVNPEDKLHLEFIEKASTHTEESLSRFEPYKELIRQEYDYLANTKLLEEKTTIVEEVPQKETISEVKEESESKKEDDSELSLPKVSIDWDNLFDEEEPEEEQIEEKSFKQVEEIQSKIKAIKEKLAKEYN